MTWPVARLGGSWWPELVKAIALALHFGLTIIYNHESVFLPQSMAWWPVSKSKLAVLLLWMIWTLVFLVLTWPTEPQSRCRSCWPTGKDCCTWPAEPWFRKNAFGTWSDGQWHYANWECTSTTLSLGLHWHNGSNSLLGGFGCPSNAGGMDCPNGNLAEKFACLNLLQNSEI